MKIECPDEMRATRIEDISSESIKCFRTYLSLITLFHQDLSRRITGDKDHRAFKDYFER